MAVFEQEQFVLWNEPDMLYPYLLTYVDAIKPAQDLIASLQDQYFFAGPDGLPGNDDAGTLSAWHVFSALGLYPVNPVSGEYRLGLPQFDDLEIQLDPAFYPGDKLTIEKIQKDLPGATFNRQLLPAYAIDHDRLVKGGNLVIYQ